MLMKVKYGLKVSEYYVCVCTLYTFTFNRLLLKSTKNKNGKICNALHVYYYFGWFACAHAHITTL